LKYVHRVFRAYFDILRGRNNNPSIVIEATGPRIVETPAGAGLIGEIP
jgi:hypothetical protein